MPVNRSYPIGGPTNGVVASGGGTGGCVGDVGPGPGPEAAVLKIDGRNLCISF